MAGIVPGGHMTALTYADGDAVPSRPRTDAERAAAASRRWRSVWRLHFYAGMLSMPFILLMALTGLVILYTQPIEDLTQGDIRTIEPAGDMVPLGTQAAAVEAAYPDATVYDVTPPGDAERATRFWLDDGSVAGMHVFVNPYTAEVTGEVKPGSGIVGLANRLHGFLNNETVTVRLPAVAALWDGDAVWREYVVGDLILELLGVWNEWQSTQARLASRWNPKSGPASAGRPAAPWQPVQRLFGALPPASLVPIWHCLQEAASWAAGAATTVPARARAVVRIRLRSTVSYLIMNQVSTPY